MNDAPPGRPSIQLAMPLLATPTPLVREPIEHAWRALFPKEPPLDVASDDKGLVAEIAGRKLAIVFMPAPVPKDEALRAVGMSWMWQEPDDGVRQHEAHAIVASMERGDALLAAADVARVSAAIMASFRGLALYWGNSSQVHTPRIVAELTKEGGWLVPLYVGVTVSGPSREGPFSATTHGLGAFGHRELEVIGTSMGLGDLRSTLLDVAGYVLRRGPVLQDGQTFGPDAKTKWSVRHAPSELVEGRAVIRLGIP
jgi:hypothetical protein